LKRGLIKPKKITIIFFCEVDARRCTFLHKLLQEVRNYVGTSEGSSLNVHRSDGFGIAM